jgi:hypothetical protein
MRHIFRNLRITSAALLCIGALCACTRTEEAGVHRLAREEVAALTARSERVLLLIFEPADCLACATDMPQMLDLRRRWPGSVAILVTRPPTAAERTVFARYRIPVDGVLGRGALPRPARGGSAFLYVNGELAASGALDDEPLRATLSREFAS